MMLQRNLLHTAVTGAKQLVVLVGSPRALGQAVRATGSGRRHTALAHRLRGGVGRTGSAATPVAVGTARG
jgi:exodeoxyribonuclease V alpha subunit